MYASDKRKIKKELDDDAVIEQCAAEFRMVGDPTRLKICYLLCRHDELSVGDISSIIGISVSAVSHTLNKLREIGIVNDRRDFRHVYYRMEKTELTKMLHNRLTSQCL